MGTRSLQASQKGIERAGIALAQYSLSQNSLAKDLGLSRQTVNNFFKGKPIDRENFALICDRLGLGLETILVIDSSGASRDKQMNSSELHTLVRDVRQSHCPQMMVNYSKIRLLDRRQIEVNQLYIDVYFLTRLSQTMQFSEWIRQIFQKQNELDARTLLQNFEVEADRLKVGVRRERREGLEVARDVKSYPRLMILGRPGAGKTTFMRKLLVACCKEEILPEFIPVLLDLRTITLEELDIVKWIQRELKLDILEKTEALLEIGKVFLLLDGLDEVAEQTQRRIRNSIQQFVRRYPANRLIVTCRLQATSVMIDGFEYIEIADFDQRQTEQFIQRWFRAQEKPTGEVAKLTPRSTRVILTAEQLINKLQKNKPIAELAVTPILLSLICWIASDSQDLPSRQADLYQQGLDLLLQDWDDARDVRRYSNSEIYRNLSKDERQQLLAFIAAHKFEDKQNFLLFDESELQQLIAEFLKIPGKSAVEVLRTIAEQHGLLVERAYKVWSFSHLSFQEYLTAQYFCNQQNWSELIHHILELKWRQVISLAVETSQPSVLLQVMKPKVDDLLGGDGKLQDFLQWVDKKAKSVRRPYKSSAIRAYYFTFAFNPNTNFDIFQDNNSASSKYKNLFDFFSKNGSNSSFNCCSVNFARAIDPDFKVDYVKTTYKHISKLLHSFTRALRTEQNPTLAVDYILYLVLYSTLKINIKDFRLSKKHQTSPRQRSSLESATGFSLNITSFPAFEEISSGISSAATLTKNTELQLKLQELQKQLPRISSGNDYQEFKKWWQVAGKTWTKQLRTLLIEHSNIGHDWQFSNSQKEQLQQYYNANKLLVDRLNGDCDVSQEVRQEIENSLLLPITKIEQKFPNQRKQC